LLKCYIRW